MKKLYLYAFCIMLFLKGQSQITINNSDMPAVNDTLRYSNGATTGFSAATILSTTGANYTWDYSTLVPTSQLLQSFKSSTSTPYALYFAGMVGYKRADSINLGPVTQKNVWDFYKNSTTKFTLEGTGFTTSGIPLASDYSDPDELYYFPLNFSDQDSGTFSVTTSIPTLGSLIQAGKRKNTVDGWGKITTPFGVFDVLRVRSVITETDTIKITSPFPFTLPFPNNRIEIKWLAKGVHIPILEVVIANNAISSIKYRDQYHYIPVAPTSAFAADNVYPKINDLVKINDQSTDIPTRWKWTITPATFTFANGTTDTSQNIQVKFSANGNYTVALRTQNNAGFNTATKNAYIKVGDAPVISFSADKVNANISDLVTLSDASTNTPTRWKWTILPSTFTYNTGSIDTLKNIGVKFNKGGFYTIDLKVTNPWGSDQTTKSNYIWINFPAGINAQNQSQLNIFPNPVQDVLTLLIPEQQEGSIAIYDAAGNKVYEVVSSKYNAINVQNLASGIYMLEWTNENQKVHARFIKQ